MEIKVFGVGNTVIAHDGFGRINDDQSLTFDEFLRHIQPGGRSAPNGWPGNTLTFDLTDFDVVATAQELEDGVDGEGTDRYSNFYDLGRLMPSIFASGQQGYLRMIEELEKIIENCRTEAATKNIDVSDLLDRARLASYGMHQGRIAENEQYEYNDLQERLRGTAAGENYVRYY